MTRRTIARLFVVVVAATGLIGMAACGESPTQPDPIVNPSPEPTPAPSPSPSDPPPKLGVTRILAFGDSMTEGTTSPPATLWQFALDAGLPRSYPFKLQALARARYTEQTIEVFNAGLAGRRASRDLDRFNSAVSEARPDVVLLLEGANDLNAPLDVNEGINDRIKHTVGSLEDMVKSAARRQLPVLLGTLPPQRPGGPKAGGAEFLTRYNDALKEMAAKKGAHIVDVFAQFPLSDIGQDGLHPTDSGYQRLAEIWLEALKGRYETAPQEKALTSPAAAHYAHPARTPRPLDLPPAPERD
ncbi:MAG: SGNH/GDSL hydrolase family protein [Vicinamibacterales bacterium]